MKAKDLHVYILLGLILFSTWLFGKIMWPYITVIAITVVVAVLAYPLYEWFKKHLSWDGLASFITLLLVTIVILIPLVVFGALVVDEAIHLIAQLQSGGAGGLTDIIVQIERWVQSIIPTADVSVEQIASQWFTLLAGNLTGIFSSALHAFASFLIGLILFFYLLKDGKNFRDEIVAKSPLGKTETKKILDRFTVVIHSVIRGNLVIALLQGILVGLGFYIFGVPNAALWAGVAAIMALIPAIGTSLVLLGGLIYIFANAGPLATLGLLGWSAVVVGLVDDALRPYLIGRGAHIHPILILLSVVGGLAVFGPVGFILGPIVLSLFIVVFEMYPEVVK
ncbi:MAG: AI-2E family transporter [Candidatus Paceibacterota bacterium]